MTESSEERYLISSSELLIFCGRRTRRVFSIFVLCLIFFPPNIFPPPTGVRMLGSFRRCCARVWQRAYSAVL